MLVVKILKWMVKFLAGHFSVIMSCCSAKNIGAVLLVTYCQSLPHLLATAVVVLVYGLQALTKSFC